MTTETVLVSTDWDPESPITTTLAGAWSQNWIAGFEGNSTTKIQTAAINYAAVTTAKIANGAVTNAKIANGAVNYAKLATGTSERDWVLGRTAAASVGTVGTYAFLAVGATFIDGASPGVTLAGSYLRYCASDGSGSMIINSPIPYGTWRCMGFKPYSASHPSPATVWMRIS